MPNWVCNKVEFWSDNKNDIEKLKKRVASKDSVFDFNKIIKRPKELEEVVAGGEENFAMKCAKAYNDHGLVTTDFYENSTWEKNSKTFMEWVELGNKYLSNKQKYGATTWYDWSWDHWGTKWNACEPSWSSDNELYFDTAWNTPEPIYKKLSEMFPTVKFQVNFADEDIGSNCGIISYDGDTFNVDYINTVEFACDVWGYDYEEYISEEEE